MLSLSRFPLGPSLCRGRLLRPGGRLSRLLRPGGRLSRLLRPGGRQSRLRRPARVASADLPESPHASAVSSAPPWWAPVSLAPHGPGPPFLPPVPPPLHHPPGLRFVWSVWKPLFGGGGGEICHESGCHSPHYNCTSPMDCISHHSLHTHTFPSTITPITQLSPFTNQPWLSCHTCTSFTHSHKSSTHTLTHCEVLFLPRLTFLSVYHSLWLLSLCFDPGLPYLGILNLCLWPRPLPGIVYVSALPLIFLLCLLTIACLILSNKYILLHLDPHALDRSLQRWRQIRKLSQNVCCDLLFVCFQFQLFCCCT